MLWGGDTSFYPVISKLKSTFHIGPEKQTSFDYLGLSVTQLDDYTIEADQDEFVTDIEYITITPAQNTTLHRTKLNYYAQHLEN